MSVRTFAAYVAREDPEGTIAAAVERRPLDSLPAGEVLIRVHYSSLNYKDALSATGNRGVTKRYPHTPGIDAAGVVEESSMPAFRPGDEVIVTGRDLGMNTSGGFAEYIRVPSGWVIPLPPGLTLREAMMLGTAGFTAAQSVMKLEQHGLTAREGEILVTGATGGVGSIAVGILAKIGCRVVAVTGKADAADMLRSLGAKTVLDRTEFLGQGKASLRRGLWDGAVDTVGGDILSTALTATRYRGAVTCCGMVGGTEFTASVFPFILRGVTLYGIDSAECPMDIRLEVWRRLADEWKPPGLAEEASECTLDELSLKINDMLKGRHRGRTIVRIA